MVVTAWVFNLFLWIHRPGVRNTGTVMDGDKTNTMSSVLHANTVSSVLHADAMCSHADAMPDQPHILCCFDNFFSKYN